MGDPDYAIILRYRVPADDWGGNPLRCPCYPDPEHEQPINASQLGEWLPEVFGDTLANFEAGQIGAVNSNADWPAPLTV